MRWWMVFLFLSSAAVARADFAEAEEDARKFEVPAGFKLEVVAAEPQLANPVAFSMDEQGRIFVAETHRLDNAVLDITKNTNWIRDDLSFRYVFERARFLTNAFGTNAGILVKNAEILRMLQDTNSDGRIDSALALRAVRKVESGLAAGVLARGNYVWFACIPDLWRIENPGTTNGTARILSTGYGVHIGVTGHDLHGLAIGMDGKLYFSSGDRGFYVKTLTSTLNYPDTGAVLRCNLDGSELEVVATGLRNPQELAFDDLGNLWTADNDTAGDDKCRLIQVVEGADYGWRCSYQHMKGFGPWVQEKLWEGRLDGTLPSCGEPAQGPAGFAFYPGTGLSPEFDGRFLLCDFPGGIQSFTVEPKGASYVIKDRKRFLWNAWPTDVDFGSDGSVYFSDWVGGWTLPNKGRIYRLTQTNAVASEKAAAVAKILQEGFEDKDVPTLIGLLENEDLRVRQGAHLILGRKRESAAALRALAIDTAKPRRARLHAIWAMKMLNSPAPEALLTDSDPEIRGQAAALAPAATLAKLLKDENARVRFLAAMALSDKLLLETSSSSIADAIIDFIAKNRDEDPYLTHAGVQLLLQSQAALRLARRHTDIAVRRAALLTERSLGLASVANYLTNPRLSYEAARAINDVPIPKAFPQLAAMLTNNCPPEILTRAINANYRQGGGTAAKRLAHFAAITNAPLAARVEALDSLNDWGAFDEIDRVVGLWRPIPPDPELRDDALALEALKPHLTALLQDREADVVVASLECVRDMEVKEQSTNVLAVFNATSRPPNVRAAALEALSALQDANFESAMEAALADKALQIGALKLIQTNATPSVITKLLELAADEKHVPAAQAAYAAIARLTPPQGADFLKKNLERLAGKEFPVELSLDLLQTADHYPALKDQAGAASMKAFADPEVAPLLQGGDAESGRVVFQERAEVSCTRCHMIKGSGGTVGPALDGVGAKQTREYLLESILDPNKAIARGFENVAVLLWNGQSLAGTLTAETALTVELNSPEDGIITIKKANIRNAQRNGSAMPEGLGQLLSPFDLRNLVEYLASLK